MSKLSDASLCAVSYNTTNHKNILDPCLVGSSSTTMICPISTINVDSSNLVLCCYGVLINEEQIAFPNNTLVTSSLSFNYVSMFPSSQNYSYNFYISDTDNVIWITNNNQNENVFN